MIRPQLVLPALALLAATHATPNAQDQAAARTGLDQEAVVAWVTERAIPLETPEAGNGFEDMEPLLDVVGNARIVSLGEATHGTREFFQLKHRMLEFLVERMGFTVFAIEASYPDCVKINDYVEHGIGDPAEALHGQGFWTWDTEEVLTLIEWMRSTNAERESGRKLRFYGIDMQSSRPAVTGVLAFVEEHDPKLAELLAKDLEPLTRPTIYMEYQGLSAEEKDRLELGLAGLLEFLDLDREVLVASTSEAAWARARQHATVVSQANQLMAGMGSAGGAGSPAFRDRCMADNTNWIFSQEPEDTRIVLWAHNGHVKQDGPPNGFAMMGHFLEQAHGDDHVVFGFGFHHGGFQAIFSPRAEDDTEPALRPFEVGAPIEASVGAVLGQSGVPLFALDLRARPAEGPVADWLSSMHPMRSIGAIYSHETAERWYRPTILTEQFDALFFLHESTAARPNPLTRKRHGIEDPK